jgi:chromosome segregation ATPase
MSKPTASARMPSRAKLAAAIERHREKADQLARVEAAIQKISDDRVNDHVSIDSARTALKIAAAGRSEILISAALGEAPPDLPSPEQAQATLDAAEAHLDNSRAALRTLEDEAGNARSVLDLAERALARAIEEVVAADPALATLKAEYVRAMARTAQLWRSLRSAGVIGANHIVERVSGDDPTWTAALARLRSDPDAHLPGLPPDEPLEHARAGGRQAA